MSLINSTTAQSVKSFYNNNKDKFDGFQPVTCSLLCPSNGILCSSMICLLLLISTILNLVSIYIILKRSRTHINVLILNQSVVDLLIAATVLFPTVLSSAASKPSIRLIVLFLDHWFYSVTMLNLMTIILDRYYLVVRQKVFAVTLLIRKSLALVTATWVSTLFFSISYIVPLLEEKLYKTKCSVSVCQDLKPCKMQGLSYFFRWLDQIVNRLLPFIMITYCCAKIVRLTLKIRHRVGIAKIETNWKKILIAAYAKSINKCLSVMILSLICTTSQLLVDFDQLATQSIYDSIGLIAAWLRLSLIATKPAIYSLGSTQRSWAFLCWPVAKMLNCFKKTVAKKESNKPYCVTLSKLQSTNQNDSMDVN